MNSEPGAQLMQKKCSNDFEEPQKHLNVLQYSVTNGILNGKLLYL